MRIFPGEWNECILADEGPRIAGVTSIDVSGDGRIRSQSRHYRIHPSICWYQAETQRVSLTPIGPAIHPIDEVAVELVVTTAPGTMIMAIAVHQSRRLRPQRAHAKLGDEVGGLVGKAEETASRDGAARAFVAAGASKIAAVLTARLRLPFSFPIIRLSCSAAGRPRCCALGAIFD